MAGEGVAKNIVSIGFFLNECTDEQLMQFATELKEERKRQKMGDRLQATRERREDRTRVSRASAIVGVLILVAVLFCVTGIICAKHRGRSER